jgi:hypothetical protein
MSHTQHHPPTSPPRLAAEILSDELWYGDNEPIWDGAPSSEQAVKKRRYCVKRLRRFARNLPSAADLADVLQTCAPYHRCKSGACPECTRAFQRWFIDSTRHLAQRRDLKGELVTASIVFPDSRVSTQLINTISIENSKRAATRSIEGSLDIQWVIGGIDISLNDDRQKNLGTGWQLQLYCIALVRDRRKFALLLKKQFPRSSTISRPVQTKDCDGSLNAFSYAFKTEFVRRIAYRGKLSEKHQGRQCWMTRKVSVSPIDHADLLVWLDSVGLAQRLYLRGLRMTVTRNGVALATVRKNE